MKKADYCAILGGGAASRMGGKKAGELIAGMPMVELVWLKVQALADETILIGGEDLLPQKGVKLVPDKFPGANSFGGIATALAYALQNKGEDALVLCTACDMPMIAPGLVAYLLSIAEGYDAVVGRTEYGFEPLLALYRARAYKTFEARVNAGNLKISSIFDELKTRVAEEGELRRFDPELHSFMNINTPDELNVARMLIGPLNVLDNGETIG